MQTQNRVRFAVLPAALGIALTMMLPAIAQDAPPAAEIVNDEGGTVLITGEVAYTNPFFTSGVAQPVIITEDQAGFVDRDLGFLMSPQSQTLAQITSDFYDSPFSYSLALPQVPQGEPRDVDQNDEDDEGVQIFAIAYWSNTFGDAYLESRDLYGGGWSTAYVSTRVSTDSDTLYEYTGGQLYVYAADDEQGFPSGFGEDGLLFTEDDPIVTLPAGYTRIDLDSDPFTFDRSREVTQDLYEPSDSSLIDFSDQGYVEAFNSLVDLFENEYAYTEEKGLDWTALRAEYEPRFERAERGNDVEEYSLALRDFLFEIPDGHIGINLNDPLITEFFLTYGGSIGVGAVETDDERVLVDYLAPGSPADLEGIQRGAEIIAVNGEKPATRATDIVPSFAPYSSPINRRRDQIAFALRFPYTDTAEITYANPGEDEQTVTLETINELDSLFYSLPGDDAFGLPVEYRLLDEGIGYVAIRSFSDNDLLSIQLWERMIRALNENGVTELVIDMRENSGGSGFLADQMAAYFFDEETVVGDTGRYDRATDAYFYDDGREDVMYPPEDEALRYDGEIAVLVGPNCASACEFFSYDMTTDDRATIVGMYPTGGLGGGVNDLAMPEGFTVRFTTAREVDQDGNVHIEGVGVIPDVYVPITEETLFEQDDAVLEAAIEALIGPVRRTT